MCKIIFQKGGRGGGGGGGGGGGSTGGSGPQFLDILSIILCSYHIYIFSCNLTSERRKRAYILHTIGHYPKSHNEDVVNIKEMKRNKDEENVETSDSSEEVDASVKHGGTEKVVQNTVL